MKNKHGIKIALSIVGLGILFIGLYQFAFATTFSESPFFQSDQTAKMSNSSKIAQASAVTNVEITFTMSEIAKYNGMNGNPAYIVVSGTIYDVTKIGEWSGGEHQGIRAGQDVTAFFANSPHAASLLNQLPIIGKVGDTILYSVAGQNPVVDTTTSATTPGNSKSDGTKSALDDDDDDSRKDCDDDDDNDDDDDDDDDDDYDDDIDDDIDDDNDID